jgi:hypothetical protein
MRGLIVVISVTALCGCSPSLIGANEAGGMISHVRMGIGQNADQAFALANASCQKYGKVAHMGGRLNGPEGPGTLSFDCVAP